MFAGAADDGSDSATNGLNLDAQLASLNGAELQVVAATAEETEAHETIMDLLDKKSDGAIWRR